MKQVVAAVGVAAMALAALSGCTIAVPSPTAPTVAQSPAPPSFAPPTIVAGHDAAAVAAAPMTFAAGTALRASVPVEFSDILGQPPQDYAETPGPPQWKLLKKNMAGQTQYSNAAGCKAAYWVTTHQGPLITMGDDKGSTFELMKYLIPSVLPDSLTETTLPWVAEAGTKGPGITFLRHNTKGAEGVMASSVWARMLGTADTALMVTLACPNDELLASTTPELMAKLSVAPPSN
ncbi:hypothetical protein [Arthrobacter glacialis]|uniref:hypothetical protein n=1 Tax=Arthrobacter glacialis TaxID=1664 RepID=UPI000CD3C680|nr:hypothetical protein [Arthrobacter glacialis]POH58408.1 hypothetical protein CVS28_11490 [Arthrobacter glacialis]